MGFYFYFCENYRFNLVDELKDVELQPRVVILHEFPTFGGLDGLEVVVDQFHALDGKIRCVAQPRQLEHVHHVVDRQPLSHVPGTSLLQLWDQVHVRQRQQMDPVLFHVLFGAPAGSAEVVSVISVTNCAPKAKPKNESKSVSSPALKFFF